MWMVAVNAAATAAAGNHRRIWTLRQRSRNSRRGASRGCPWHTTSVLGLRAM